MKQIEGRNQVLVGLERNVVNIIYISQSAHGKVIEDIVYKATEKMVDLRYVSKYEIDNMSKTRNNQGVIAILKKWEYYDFNELLLKLRKKENPFILVLDHLKDPHNLGAILRTADATGVDAVIIPKDRSVEVTPTVTKVSVGATEHIPVIKVTNIARTIDKLKEKKYWITAADMDGEKAFFESDLKGNVGIVIGSEGEGIRRLVREKCDFIVNIPMKGRIQSLNASVAASILMYEVVRQNHGKN